MFLINIVWRGFLSRGTTDKVPRHILLLPCLHSVSWSKTPSWNCQWPWAVKAVLWNMQIHAKAERWVYGIKPGMFSRANKQTWGRNNFESLLSCMRFTIHTIRGLQKEYDIEVFFFWNSCLQSHVWETRTRHYCHLSQFPYSTAKWSILFLKG